MLGGKNNLFVLSAAGMELSWLYALSCSFFLLAEAPLFPPWIAVLFFLLAAGLTSLLRGRGLRIIAHIIFHLLLYLVLLLWSLYVYGAWAMSFWSGAWLELLFKQQYSLQEGFVLFQIPFWSFIFWYGGLAMALRSSQYFGVTSRFDIGIVAFLLTYIIIGAAELSFPNGGLLIVSFFLFSMLSIALVRNLGGSKADYLPRFRGIGSILAFAGSVLLFGAGALLFLLPYLTTAAERGLVMVEGAARPLGSLMTRILLFIYGSRSAVEQESPEGLGSHPGEGMERVEPSWWELLLEQIVVWSGLGILILLFLALAGWGLWSLWKWFFTREAVTKERKGLVEEILLWLVKLYVLFKELTLRARKKLWPISMGQGSAAVFFLRLVKWGSSSGLSRSPNMTPREYSSLLCQYFPDIRKEIELIVEGFNREFYGKRILEKEQAHLLKKAWRRLSNPVIWPRRLFLKLTGISVDRQRGGGIF